MKTTGVIGLVWLVAGVCSGAKLPSGYKRCGRKSSDIDQCLTQALQDVLAKADRPLPDIGLPSVDPLTINYVHIPARSGVSVTIDQKYSNGQLLGFKNSEVKMLKCTFHMTSPFVITEKNGNKHLKFKNSVLHINPEHIYYNFENLFNGNKELGDNINRVLNENWYQIFRELEEGLAAAYGAILEGVANSVCAKVPLSELFLD